LKGKGYKLKLIILFLFALFFIFLQQQKKRSPPKDPFFCILQTRRTLFFNYLEL